MMHYDSGPDAKHMNTCTCTSHGTSKPSSDGMLGAQLPLWKPQYPSPTLSTTTRLFRPTYICLSWQTLGRLKQPRSPSLTAWGHQSNNKCFQHQPPATSAGHIHPSIPAACPAHACIVFCAGMPYNPRKQPVPEATLTSELLIHWSHPSLHHFRCHRGGKHAGGACCTARGGSNRCCDSNGNGNGNNNCSKEGGQGEGSTIQQTQTHRHTLGSWSRQGGHAHTV